MERKQVYEAIDSERDYQDAMTKSSFRPDMIEDFHLGDTLSAIQYNLNKALDAWYKGVVPHPESIEYIRKIAGLSVKIMEVHGVQKRSI